MKKTFALNIVLLIGLNLFVKVLYLLGIDRQFQLELGTTDYGLYYKLLNFTLLFQFINDFGIQNYTNRWVSQNRGRISIIFNDLLVLKILLSLGYGISVVLIILVTNYEQLNLNLILYLVLNQILVSAVFFVRSCIAGLGYYKTDSVLSILDRVLLIVIGAMVLWHPALKSYINIQGFIWIQMISIGSCLLFASSFLFLKGMQWRRPKLELKNLKSIFVSCLPFSLIYLFSTLYNKIDIFLIGCWLENGDEQAGIYATSMRLFEASSMVSLAFGSLLLAMFSVLYKDVFKLTELLVMALNLLFAFTIALVISCCFYAKEIMNLLYHQNNPYWEFIFILVLISFLPASINYIYGALFQALHKEKQLFMFYFLAGIMSFVLNFYLIKSLQLIGVAYVTILVHGFLFMVQFIYLQKNKLIYIDTLFWIRILLLIILAICSTYLLKTYISDWKAGLISSFIVIMIISFQLKMIDLNDFIRIKKSINTI